MNNYEVSTIRNVGLISHVGTGKTSLADAMLFNAGQNTRLGKVEQETSLLDYEFEEIKRKTTISSSVASFNWKNCRINLIDTPGSSNFISDSILAMQAIDTAIFVIDAIDGIKLQTAKLIKKAQELDLSMCIYINKIDRENSNYKLILDKLNSTFAAKPVLLQLPIGQETSFKGIINLLTLKAFSYALNESGKSSELEISTKIKEDITRYRDSSIESIVECDDEILEKYLEGKEVSEEEILTALKKGIINKQIVPVLIGSSGKNIGIDLLLDFINSYCPSPVDRGIIIASSPNNEQVELKPNSAESLSAFVFKTIADPFAGHLTMMRIFSGEIHSDSFVYNSTKKVKERIGQMLHLVGKKHEVISKAIAGDIIAIAKLKETQTEDSFSDEKKPVHFNFLSLPTPVISYAIKPKSKGDEDKIMTGLKRLIEEDLTLHISRDEQTNEMILSGIGQVHLEVAIEKLKRKFGVEVLLETPKIPYKETISTTTKVQGKYKKQSGGKGQYGDCWIEINPIEKGKGFQFVDKIIGGSIPRQYIPAVETGIKEAMNEGILAGYPVVDIEVVLFDGSYHPVDSSEMAFKVAGSMAFKKAATIAKPVILEPIMHVEIVVPSEYVGDIMGDLNSKRGRMLGVEAQNSSETILAEIPMLEMLKYAADLNSITSGTGLFTMEFAHYEEVPAHLAQKIITENEKNKETASK